MRGADFHRHLVRLTALLSTLALTACGAPTNTESAPSGPDALLGVWVPSAAPERLLTAAGQPPPLNAEAAGIHAARLELLAAGDRSFDQTTWCASPGMPRVLTMPYPFEIRRDGDYLAFIHGWYRWHRVVNLAGVEVDPPFPLTMGFPVGHWEDDTLVIRTVGLSDVAVLDASGLPRSEQMVLTERLRVLPDGRLENRITIDDPETFTQPWETVLHFRRDASVRVTDDICPDRIAYGEPAVRREPPPAATASPGPTPAAAPADSAVRTASNSRRHGLIRPNDELRQVAGFGERALYCIQFTPPSIGLGIGQACEHSSPAPPFRDRRSGLSHRVAGVESRARHASGCSRIASRRGTSSPSRRAISR